MNCITPLPTIRWTGTERPPGGFAPLGRLPATRFGELGFTEGITFRKNRNPFRISGGVYYTYSAPGSDAGRTTYVGDIINTRLIFEPVIQFKFTDSLVKAVGMLFTVAGQNARDAIYPNFSFQWYWNKGKQVIMR